MRYAFLAVGFCLLFSANLQASLTYPPTYNEMFELFEADALVRAEVKDKKALYVTTSNVDEYGREGERTLIYTRYLMVLKDVVTGESPPGVFYLYLQGGEVDGTHMSSSSSFELQTDWDVVLFLQHDARNDMYVSAGTAQTVFVVHEVGETSVLINLRNGYPPTQQITPENLILQGSLDKNKKIYSSQRSSFLSYGVLKASYQGGSR